MRRVLITGSRDWADDPAIWAVLDAELSRSADGIIVVHGCCARGADLAASRWAIGYRYPEWRFPADWARYGRAAGARRNRLMLTETQPDVVYAFPLDKSRGTWDCVRAARAIGVPVEIFGDAALFKLVP